MKVLIVDNGSSHLRELERLCAEWDTTVLAPTEVGSSDPSAFDVIILSGSHERGVVGNDRYFSKEYELIKVSETPIIGVCLGFELIAYHAGAELYRLDSSQKGTVWVHPTPEGSNWFGKGPIMVYEAHRWVVKGVPAGYVALAESSDGVEAIGNLTRKIIGFQFHPEHLVAKSIADNVFKNVVAQLTT